MASSLSAAARLAKNDSPEEQIRRIVAEMMPAAPEPPKQKPPVIVQQHRSSSVFLNGVSSKLKFVNAGDENYPTLLSMCIDG